MKVVEIFDSIDGEGLRTGAAVTFIRLAGCNLRCSYCDTLYALFGEAQECKYTEMDVNEIAKKVKFKRVTLTGGEPLLHKDVDRLINTLINNGVSVNIETNGAVDITPFLKDNVMLTIDYKLPSSSVEDRMIMDNFYKLRKCDVIKFVVGTDLDKTRMCEIMRDLKAFYKENMPHVFAGAVYGIYDNKDLVNDILNNEELHDVRLQLQIHKIIWDKDKRGV